MKLGVRTTFSREKNLEIIFEQYKRNPELTIQQVNALSRFKAFKHVKGLIYPLCKCLRCMALYYLIESRNAMEILEMKYFKELLNNEELKLLNFKP